MLCAEEPVVRSTVRAEKGVSDNQPIDETRADGDVDVIAVAAVGCETVGGWEIIPPFTGSNRFRANAYLIAGDVNLVEFSMELVLGEGVLTVLEFVGYQLDTETGIWERMADDPLLKVVNGEEKILKDWTTANIINTAQPNRIKIECVGSTITAFINGKEVVSVRDSDIRSGGYALLAGPGIAGRYDNFELRGIAAE